MSVNETNYLDIKRQVEDFRDSIKKIWQLHDYKLMRNVCTKLKIKLKYFPTQIPGATDLIVQKLNNKKDMDIDIDKICTEVKNEIIFSINYISKNLPTDKEELKKVIKIAIKNRDNGLSKYWNDIEPNREKITTILLNQYGNKEKAVVLLCKGIETLIEPMLREDSSLFIEAYEKRNNNQTSSNSDKLWFLLNKVYREALPRNYYKTLINYFKDNSLDFLRELRNILKHGNYNIIKNKIIVNKGPFQDSEFSVDELFRIYSAVTYLRIFCRTVQGYIIDAVMTNYWDLNEVHGDRNISLSAVIEDLNSWFLEKEMKIIFSEDDYISTVLKIDGEEFPDISKMDSVSQKAYLKLKIKVGNRWDLQSNLINIYKILKIIREAYSGEDISIDDLIAAVHITDGKSINTCVYVAFNELTELLNKSL
jgi:hypothetical protein